MYMSMCLPVCLPPCAIKAIVVSVGTFPKSAQGPPLLLVLLRGWPPLIASPGEPAGERETVLWLFPNPVW